MIRGPIGERRLDENFAFLRMTLHACHSGDYPPVDELRLKYDWKRCFPKEDFDAIETLIVENLEKDMAFLESRFGGKQH